MKSGNGMDMPGSLRAENIFDVDVRLRRSRLTFQPYTSLLAALRGAGADVLVFPYDWRLSLRHSAQLLQQAILARWFGGVRLRDVGTVSEAERITFIGHSMGAFSHDTFWSHRAGTGGGPTAADQHRDSASGSARVAGYGCGHGSRRTADRRRFSGVAGQGGPDRSDVQSTPRL
jgi:hypothetical protein